MKMNLIEHIETTLGQIQRGWEVTCLGFDFQIVKIRNRDFEEVITYMTLGFSDLILKLSESKDVRQELIFSIYEEDQEKEDLVLESIMEIATSILDNNAAILRGDVVQLHRANNPMYGLYATSPSFVNGDFAVFDHSLPPTVMVWLFPVFQKEHILIQNSDWNTFESLLEKNHTDALDFDRPSIA